MCLKVSLIFKSIERVIHVWQELIKSQEYKYNTVNYNYVFTIKYCFYFADFHLMLRSRSGKLATDDNAFTCHDMAIVQQNSYRDMFFPLPIANLETISRYVKVLLLLLLLLYVNDIVQPYSTQVIVAFVVIQEQMFGYFVLNTLQNTKKEL